MSDVQTREQMLRSLDKDAAHARLLKALEAASGYMENARIDLETGAPKRTAVATLAGGLAAVKVALAQARALEQPTGDER